MRTALLCLIPVLLLATGCAHPPPPGPANREGYRVTWTAHRASDHALLAAVTSPPLRVGAGEVRVRTDSRRAEDGRPALPEFLARLSPTRQPGVVELVARATVLEAVRNKKGKVKVHRRFIGGLLPMRAGEKLGVSGPGDPILFEVELNRAR